MAAGRTGGGRRHCASRPNGVIAVVGTIVIAIGSARRFATGHARRHHRWWVPIALDDLPDRRPGPARVLVGEAVGRADADRVVTDLTDEPLALFHLGVFLVFVVPDVMRWRCQPVAWSTW